MRSGWGPTKRFDDHRPHNPSGDLHHHVHAADGAGSTPESAPHLGKSWLALNIAASGAMGGRVSSSVPSIPSVGPVLGAYVAPVSVGGITGLTRFGDAVGRPVSYATAYIDARSDWSNLADPAWLLDPWAVWLKADPSRRLILSVPMLLYRDEGRFDDTTHDGAFVALAQSIDDRGIASQVIIRLGYEMNGDWMPWGRQFDGNADGSGFREMWRRIVPKMKAVYNFPFDWCVVPDVPTSAGGGYSPNFYPGDDVVDIVGIDLYDAYVSGSPDQRWQQLQAKLDWTAGFAATHGKAMAFDEWALWSPNNSSGGGDDPTYITGMLGWAANHNLVWTSYFNSREGNVETTLESNPAGLAAFRSYLGH